uniref:SET domain-containing protein n=1 Tax=Chrysotila carterae TaxID=13221 RepID=A0A7S4F8A8_CHRCT|mmetsp:Transcript_1512/g.2999  ORF Transcript_1512/g.2999 Transcript_1512/m.2999 type:complete len:476 (-) Transcript_1512:122-1549(-)
MRQRKRREVNQDSAAIKTANKRLSMDMGVHGPDVVVVDSHESDRLKRPRSDDACLRGPSFSIRETEDRGRSMHATSSLCKNKTIITEIPMAALQLPESALQCTTCDRCLRAVGTIAEHLQLLAGRKDPPSLPLAEDDDGLLASLVRCRRRECDAVFCSADCEAKAHLEYHEPLCTSSPKRRRLLREFTKHALAENETFIFGGRLVASVHTRARRAQTACTVCHGLRRCCGACLDRAQAELAAFCRAVWWDITEPDFKGEGTADPALSEAAASVGAMGKPALGERTSLSAAERASFKRQLRSAAATSHELLVSAFEEPTSQWLTLHKWGEVLGLARRNCLCVEYASPVAEIIPTLRAWSASGAGSSTMRREISALLDALPTKSPSMLGTALYPNIACANHDCDPNAEVHFCDESALATLVATRSIAKGEEICISYIECKAPLQTRRTELREYGFLCSCRKCSQQAAWHRRLRSRHA